MCAMGMSLRSCDVDARVGGKYRLEFEPDAMAFFGTYLEVTPHSRLVWTNEEGGEGGPVTTVTFEEKGGKTLLVMHELYSSNEALDGAGIAARWPTRNRPSHSAGQGRCICGASRHRLRQERISGIHRHES
jgi:uncharacterized protein YndB with AHSA1/START domain